MPRVEVEVSEELLEEMKAYQTMTAKSIPAQIQEALEDYKEVTIGAQIDVYCQHSIQ